MPGFARIFGALLVVVVVASATQAEPQPALSGDGLPVLVLLVVFLGAVLVAVLRRGDADWRDLLFIAAGALGLTVIQPGGAGFLALYMTLGIACVHLRPRYALGCFLAGVVAISALQAVADPGDASLAAIAFGDAIGTLFFVMGYSARRARMRVVELEATREADAQAIALRERARLAREMHDVLAHSLSALAVQLEGARLLARSRDTDPAVTEAIERSHGLARAGLEEARRAIEALRGGEMPGPDRLPGLCRQFSEGTSVDCDLHLDGAPRELSSEARLAVYRTAQEALTNVRRHARPAHVDVALRYDEDGTRLVVEDHRADGDGGTAHPEREPGLGYGLEGMRERAELLGGRLAAAPTPTGFRVELFLPEAGHGA